MMKRIKDFLRKHWGKLCIVFLCTVVAGYFVNIIFFENKKDVLTVLVLQTEVDREVLTNELQKAVAVKQGEEISIQTLDYSNSMNQGTAVTWLRSGTIDLIVGNREQMTAFGQHGYLKRLEGMGDLAEKEKFRCGTAEFDDEGNLIRAGGNDWVGVFPGRIAGIDSMDSPVIAIVENAPNKENAFKTLEMFCK